MAVSHPTQTSVELRELIAARAGRPPYPEGDAEAERYLLTMRLAAADLHAELTLYLANVDRRLDEIRAALTGQPEGGADPDPVPDPLAEPDPDPELCLCGCRRVIVQSGNRPRIWWSDACRKRGRGGWTGTLPLDAVPFPPGVIHTLGISTAAAAA